jgi:hypothetical protein
MPARPRDSWATFLRLSHARATSKFLTLSNWDQPAKGDNPDRKYWSSRIAGGWAWGKQPHPVKQPLLRNPQKMWGRPKPTLGCSAEEEEEEADGCNYKMLCIPKEVIWLFCAHNAKDIKKAELFLVLFEITITTSKNNKYHTHINLL